MVARMSRLLWLGVVMVGLVFGAAGCSTGSASRPNEAPMTLVYLLTGPNSASHSREQKGEIFKGHMANMQRLADERILLVAGPFGSPREKTWRGIFVFDVAEPAEAESIAATDPGVSSGEFAVRVRPILVSTTIRESLRLEDEMQAELRAQGEVERAPGGMPPGLRGYVMMHADDAEGARRELRARAGSPRVIWWGRFRDGKDGVLVLDAADVAAAAAGIGEADVGPHGLDGWYSTKALEGLPREGGESGAASAASK